MPGRPSATSAARSASGPAAPTARSGANDHLVPQRTPGPFRKLDAIAVLTGPLLPAPQLLVHPGQELGQAPARQRIRVRRRLAAFLDAGELLDQTALVITRNAGGRHHPACRPRQNRRRCPISCQRPGRHTYTQLSTNWVLAVFRGGPYGIDSSALPADQTVAMWRRVTWITLHNGSCRDAQIDPFGRMTDGRVVDQFADHIGGSVRGATSPTSVSSTGLWCGANDAIVR